MHFSTKNHLLSFIAFIQHIYRYTSNSYIYIYRRKTVIFATFSILSNIIKTVLRFSFKRIFLLHLFLHIFIFICIIWTTSYSLFVMSYNMCVIHYYVYLYKILYIIYAWLVINDVIISCKVSKALYRINVSNNHNGHIYIQKHICEMKCMLSIYTYHKFSR